MYREGELPFHVEPRPIARKAFEEKIKEFEAKLAEKEKVYKEEIGSVKTERDSIKKMLDDIKSKQKEGNVFCPTCITKDEHGHEHKHEMKYIGNETYKCTGPNCGSEKVFVDLDSDFECEECGFPHKKIKDKKVAKEYKCPIPGCTGKRMVPISSKWAKLAERARTGRK